MVNGAGDSQLNRSGPREMLSRRTARKFDAMLELMDETVDQAIDLDAMYGALVAILLRQYRGRAGAAAQAR